MKASGDAHDHPEHTEHKKYAFLAIFLILAYLTYLVIKPFLTYAVLGLTLTIAAFPLYEWINKRLQRKVPSSIVTMVIIILIIVIPMFLILSSLVNETIQFFSGLSTQKIISATQSFSEYLGANVNLDEFIRQAVRGLSDFAIGSSTKLLNSLSNMTIGIVIMFAVMFFGFIEGKEWADYAKAFLPFKDDRKESFIKKVKKVINIVILGDLLIAAIQGFLGGLIFFFMGIPNPVFWGFVMGLFAFLPFVGAPLVWIPVVIIKLFNGEIISSIVMVLYFSVIVGSFDYLFKPKIISDGSKIHPLSAIIGVFGGLKLFGFTGILLGPLITSLFEVIILFYYEDYVKEMHERSSLAVKRALGSERFQVRKVKRK